MSWEDDLAAAGSNLNPSGDFGNSYDSNWNGTITTDTVSQSDPLGGFQSVVNAGTALLNAVVGVQAAQTIAQQSVLDRNTSRYLAQTGANVQKAQADAALAAAQKPMQAGAGKYDTVLMWCAVLGLGITVFMAMRHK